MVRASLLIFASLFAKTSASCSPGNFLDGASCTTCPAARWQELDSYEGTSCPNECGTATVAGKYAAATGQTSEAKACVDTATACGAGRYGAVTGMTSSADACPNECDAGRYGTPTGKTLVAEACNEECDAGKFGAATGKSLEAEACDSTCGTATVAGKYATATGQSSEAKACVDTATACGAATIAGRYATETGKTSSVEACAGVECGADTIAGKYANATGQTSSALACTGTACAVGKFGNATGKTLEANACRDCAAGRFSGSGTGYTACGGRCSQGRFSTRVGIASSDQCLGRCSAGRWSNRTGVSHNDGCLGACSSGRWSNGSVGLIFDWQCSGRCAAGTFMGDGSVGNINGSKCQGLCSKGRYSAKLGLTSDFGCEGRCGMGKYSIALGLTSGADCKRCPQGTTTNSEGASSKRSCVVPPAEVTSFRPECGEIIDAVEGENATSTAATLCSNNGAEQRMTLYGTNFKETTTVTVGGTLCSDMSFNKPLASESSQVTCRLPRTAGGAMLIRLDGVVPQGLDKPFVMFGCPSDSIEAPRDPLKPSACVFDLSDRSISPPTSPCPVLDITNMASGGCNKCVGWC